MSLNYPLVFFNEKLNPFYKMDKFIIIMIILMNITIYNGFTLINDDIGYGVDG